MTPERPAEGQAVEIGHSEPRATEIAERSARGHLVPKYDGGAQVEWHQDGWDVEFEFDAEGHIVGLYVSRA